MRDEWPAFFPEDCPPKESSGTVGEAYRLVHSERAAPSDFLSLYELKGPREDAPSAYYGVSMFRDLSKALSSQKISHGVALSCPYVAKGILQLRHGRCSKPSKSSHISVWICISQKEHIHEGFDVEAKI